jgi:predicted enzyme related to lactoylglutathione lyase
MNTPTVKTVIYPVTDLAAAKSVFGALTGGDPVMDEPYYVQFHVDDVEIGLDPNGARQGLTGPVAYWHVDDIDASLAALVEAGAMVHKEVNDFGGSGRKVASVTDPSGNVVGLIQTS